MRTNNKNVGLELSHLINKINYILKNKTKDDVSGLWIELQNRLKNISWDEKLIEMYNKEFFNNYIKNGELKRKFEYKNGVPTNWEIEDNGKK